MATYQELKSLFKDSDLLEKVEVAIIIAANGKIAGTAAEQAWAVTAFNNPTAEAKKALMSVLAANNASTVETIQGAADATIQTNVDAVTDVLVAANGG